VKLSRRDFLKLSGATAGGAAALSAMPAGVAAKETSDEVFQLNKKIGETTTICCYCAVGCGAIATADEEGVNILNIEGDPDHPINEGTLCSKGQALPQFHTVDGAPNPWRLTKPLKRNAGASDWHEISWDTAISEIAQKIKGTRDDNWLETVDVGGTDRAVNRTDAICSFGGGELDNEECYLLVKMARALGLVYVEHCARI